MLEWTEGFMYHFKLVFLFSLDKYQGLELLDHMIVLFLHFWESSTLFSTVAAPNYISTSSAQGSFFSTSLPILDSCPLDNSHCGRCEVKPHSGFNLHFPDD